MGSAHQDHGVKELIIVLRVALGRITFRTYIQSQIVEHRVGKVGKLPRHSVALYETRVRKAEVVGDTWGKGPGVGQNKLAAVCGVITGELLERRVRIDVGLSLTIVKEAPSELVLLGVQIGIDVEVILVEESSCRWLNRSDWNAHSAHDLRGRVRHGCRWKLLQNVSHGVVARQAGQQCQS